MLGPGIAQFPWLSVPQTLGQSQYPGDATQEEISESIVLEKVDDQQGTAGPKQFLRPLDCLEPRHVVQDGHRSNAVEVTGREIQSEEVSNCELNLRMTNGAFLS